MMKERNEQNCPICNTPAEYVGADFGRRKSFNCTRCSFFQISNSAEKKVTSAPQNWKDALSQKAKTTPEGQVLVITTPLASEINTTSESLVANYVPEEKVPS